MLSRAVPVAAAMVVYPPAGTPDPLSMAVRTERPKVTPPRAALLLAFERYRDRALAAGLSESEAISLVEAQKIAYFLQLAGGKTRWRFEPSHFGPYASAIDQFISHVEGHYIRGYGDGSGGSRATLTLDSPTLDESRGVMRDDDEFADTLRKFEAIVDGFEFPYGIELLSTVHYVVAHSPHPPSVDEVVAKIEAWSARKGRLFKAPQAAAAYRHLQRVELADASVKV